MVTWTKIDEEDDDEPNAEVTWTAIDEDPRGSGWDWVRKSLGVPKAGFHGVMDFLHYTIARPGSGAWRMNTQLAEHAEAEQIRRFYGEGDPSKIQSLSSEDIKNLPLYLRSQVLQYGDPKGQQDIAELMIEGGAEAAVRGFKEGFTYDADVPVESIWDITASGTAETRAQDWLMSPAGPGAEWVEANPKKAMALGFLMDVGYDPITIFPTLLILPIKLTAQSMVAAVKLAHKHVPGVAPVTAKIADAPAMQHFMENFGVYLGGEAKEVQQLFVQHKHFLTAKNFRTVVETKEGQRVVAEISERLGIPVEQFKRTWLRIIEGDPTRGGTIPGPFPHAPGPHEYAFLGFPRSSNPAVLAAKDIEDYRGMIDEATSDIPIPGSAPEGFIGPPESVGVVSGRNMADISGERAQALGVETGHYYPHINVQSGIGRLFSKWTSNRGKTGPEFQRLGIGMAEEQNLVEGTHFMLDPTAAHGLRGIAQNYIMAGQQFLRDAAIRWGRTAENAPSDWVPISGVKGVVFHPHTANILSKNFGVLSNTSEVNKFERFFDQGTRWWKMWALALRPSYHARNLFGNMWNSYAVGGMRNPKYFKESSVILRQAMGRKFSGELKLGDYGTISREQLFNDMLDQGVIGVGRYFEDDLLRGAGIDPKVFAGMDSGSRWQAIKPYITLSTRNQLLQLSFKGGRAIENWNRASLYLDALARTGSKEKARKLVNDALFDYTDISANEARWLRNKAVPFYTWYRKNWPAIIKGMWRHPGRYRKADIAKENIEFGVDIPTYEEMTDWAKDRDPVFVDKFFGEAGRDDIRNLKRFINLVNYFPAADINRLGTPQQLLMELGNPFIKMALEQFTNHSYFSRGEIANIPTANPILGIGMGEMKDFMGLRMPARLAYMVKMFPLLSEIDRINPALWNEKWTQPGEIISNVFPSIPQVNLPTSGIFGKASVDQQTGERTTTRAEFTPWWQDEATLRETRFEDMDGMPRFIAWLLGMRTFTYDPEMTVTRKGQQNVRAINKTKRDLLYYYRQAKIKGNVDAAAEILKTYEMFVKAGYATDPLDYGIDPKLLNQQ